MRIWLISDTHNHHDELEVPSDIDAVIHCGDESDHGNSSMNEPEARRFLEWYSSLEIATRILVPGNHSTAIEAGLIRPGNYPDIHFLIHEQMDWQGLKIFGSPFTPKFFDWAYMKPRQELDSIWQSIPDKTDILITHGPPKGILDVTRDMDSGEPVHVGSKSLRRQVENRIRPRLHAFGHLHDEAGINNYGTVTRGGTQFINCACCNLASRLVHDGFVIEVEAQKTASNVLK